MVMFVLSLSGLAYLSAAQLCYDEECLSSIGLLQFNIDLSASDENGQNSTFELGRSSHAKTRRNISVDQRSPKLITVNLKRGGSSHKDYLQGDIKQVASGINTPKPLVVWTSLLLLFVTISLILHLRPMLADLWNQSAQDRGQSVFEDDRRPSRAYHSSIPGFCYGILYIVSYGAYVEYNRYLMTEGNFPFAVNLTFGHQASGFVFFFAFYKFRPSLYPTIATVNRRMCCLGLLPIAVCFSGQLVLSNIAYLFTSVAFLQIMKEANLVLVYTMSLMAGLEYVNGIQARILLCLLLSTAIAIHGQINLSMTAVIVQGSSQLMESTKLVLTSMLLSATNFGRLDPYSYNLTLQPISAVLLGCFLCICAAYMPEIAIASWADYVAWGPHLVANCALALSMNVSAALLITHSTTIGFIAAGLSKDVTLVTFDVLLYKAHLSMPQIIAFSLQICFICLYSLYKTFEKHLELEKAPRS